MPAFNKVVLVGTMVKDVELKYTSGSTPVAVTEAYLAINEKIKRGGSLQDEVTYVSVTIWGKNAENVEKYLGKGSNILIDGRLKIDKWTDKQTGKEMQKLKVVADSVQFLDGKPQGNKSEAPQRQTETSSSQSRQQNQDAEEIPF